MHGTEFLSPQSFPDTIAIDFSYPLHGRPRLSQPSAVSVGNPHCVFWVADDPDSYDLAAFGPELKMIPSFPNVRIFPWSRLFSEQAIKLRVWERGAGLTRACGTAACATAVAAARAGKAGRKVEVRLPGGALTIEWRETEIISL